MPGRVDEACKCSNIFEENGLRVRYIHIGNLLQAKKASGRHKDLDDIEKLSQYQLNNILLDSTF